MEISKGYISQVRLPGDTIPVNCAVTNSDSASYANRFYLNDLLIQVDVLPKLFELIELVITRLDMSIRDISAFVYASPFLQAECYKGPNGSCVIRISSALVETLNDSELMFVLGHEIGHYLFGHLDTTINHSSDNLEEILVSKRRELSADRIGLLASRSLSSSLNAIMKTMSGLTSRHLNFNVASFISQLSSYDRNSISSSEIYGSHPNWLFRSRALLWFSLNHYFQNESSQLDEKQISAINVRILRELEKYIEYPIKNKIEAATLDIRFWYQATLAVTSGSFSRANQQQMTSEFGEDMVDKLKLMLSGLSTTEALEQCRVNLEIASQTLHLIAPKQARIAIDSMKFN